MTSQGRPLLRVGCSRWSSFTPVRNRLRALAFALAIVAMLTPRPLWADEVDCAADVTAWLHACAQRHALDIRRASCPAGRLLLDLHVLPTSLTIEIVKDRPGFRQAGTYALSPLVNVQDWDAQPAAQRAALDDLAQCLTSGQPVPPFATAPPKPVVPHADERPPVPEPPAQPLLLLLAVALAAGLLLPRLLTHLRAAPTSPLLLGLGLPFATFALRRALFPQTFVHQDGLGPFWIQEAIGAPHVYGSGYHEIFSWFALQQPLAPEAAIFLWQGALAAWQPTLAWLLVRSTSGSRALAWTCAGLLAIDPAFGRLSGSESYFSVGTTLLLAAGALLATTPLPGQQPLRRLAHYAAAGLLVAQAARVHPLLWLPAATLAVVVVWQPGPLRLRLREAWLAAGVVAVVVCATSAPSLLAVLHTPAHTRFLSTTAAGKIQDGLSLDALAALVLVAILIWQRARAAVVVATFVLLQAVMHFQPTVSIPVVVREGLLLPFSPALLACLGALVPRLPKVPLATHGLLVLTLLLGGLGVALRWTPVQQRATDVVEFAECLAWRTRLGPQDGVLYVDHVPSTQQGLTLPLYPSLPHQPGQLRRLEQGKRMIPFSPMIQRVYYYRSSLCATPAVQTFCADFERTTALRPIWQAELPAVPSMPHMPYATPTVPVALFAVISPTVL